MIDDVIKLISAKSYDIDSEGNQTQIETTRRIFCRVRSIGRSEYYQAAQTDLHPEYTFVLSNYKDYRGEKEVIYTDWTGSEKRFDIIRVYRVPDTDELELTAQERISDYGDR